MLFDQIKTDLVAAMKAKEAEKLSVLRMLQSALKNEAIDLKKDTLTDEEVFKVIKSEVKKRKDSIDSYVQGGREDLAEGEKKEVEILSSYLPAQMSSEQIESKIDEVLAGLSAEQKGNFGMAMGAVMKAVGASADGNLVREILNKKLNS